MSRALIAMGVVLLIAAAGFGLAKAGMGDDVMRDNANALLSGGIQTGAAEQASTYGLVAVLLGVGGVTLITGGASLILWPPPGAASDTSTPRGAT